MASAHAEIDIPALAEALLGVDGLFDRRDSRVALALYRLLAEGEPVSEECLADRSRVRASRVGSWLRDARVERDEHGRLVAFQGLSLAPTRHVLDVGGRTLYAWCAADTLLIHDLLRQPTRVRSTDPLTGTAVTLSLANGRVRGAEPATPVLSLVRPGIPIDDLLGVNVVPAACGPINFFASEGSGRTFIDRVDGTFLLTIEQGLELARRVNQELFGPLLVPDVEDA